MDAVLAVSVLAMASAVAWAAWVISYCQVSFEAMSSMVRSAKQGGWYKNSCILETVGLIELKLGQNVPKGMLYLWMCSRWHHHVSIGVMAPLQCSYAFWGCILGVRQSFGWLKTRKDTPFCVSKSTVPCGCMNVHLHVLPSFVKVKDSSSVQTSVHKELEFYTHHCHHNL